MAKSEDPFPSQVADKYVVRFPDGMRDRIAEAAKANNRTMNAEIVARLEASFEPKAEVAWSLRVDARANNVAIETTRSHLFAVQSQLDRLTDELSAVQSKGADRKRAEELEERREVAHTEWVRLSNLLQDLLTESRRLTNLIDRAAAPINEAIDEAADKTLQGHYRSIHESEETVDVPQEKRQIVKNPKPPAAPQPPKRRMKS